MPKRKPVVLYRPTLADRIKVGMPAFVLPINHPSALVSNTTFIWTSPVQSVDEKHGEFETMNTLYRAKKGVGNGST